MILGIGTDLATIELIAAMLDRVGDRFRNRVFTPVEQRNAEQRRDVAGTYARLWAVKEASGSPGYLKPGEGQGAGGGFSLTRPARGSM